MEVTSGANCVLIPIVPLSLCPSYWNITSPIIQHVSVSAFPKLKLYVTWKNFLVTNKLTEQSITVPSVIDIDFVTWRMLKLILSQPFSAYILIVHHGIATVLPDQTVKKSGTTNVPNVKFEDGNVSLYPSL